MSDSITVVLGAGPAGLFAARELQQLGRPAIVIEKENYVGGLAATHTIGEGRYEVGPHIFHTEDQYILEAWKEYLGEELELKHWRVAQYLDEQFLQFPNSLLDMWQKLGSREILLFLLSFIKNRTHQGQDLKSFLYRKVGRRLAHFNIINYTEKMWGVPIDELEVDWIKPRLARLSYSKIIKSSIYGHGRTFHYPRYGAGSLYEAMASDMDVRLGEWPVSMEHKDGRIQRLKTNKREYEVENLYSSIPLQSMLKPLSPAPSSQVISAVDELRHRSQMYVILLVDHVDMSEQWIYFPQSDLPFSRVHSAGAFSEQNVPSGMTLLVFEYFCFDTDEIWGMSDDALVSLTQESYQSLPLMSKLDIHQSEVIRKKYAYPLLCINRASVMATIEDYLRGISNVHLIGRHGLHTYDNQHDASASAVRAVRNAL